jgi:Beta-galactosidase/beta-glucuronidase
MISKQRVGKKPGAICLTLVTSWAVSCSGQIDPSGGPAKVEIRKTDKAYTLYVNNRPFYIKGAGLGGGGQDSLARHGANSLRTWGSNNGRAVLNRALTNGFYVTMGLPMGLERSGFNYNDTNAVNRQLEAVKAEVLKYKDHPALIIWAIGNELNLRAKNPKVWDAVNDISKMIHQIDTNHLTTTPLASINPQLIHEIKTRAPDLDLLAIQMYGDIVNLPNALKKSEWDKPYIITEWGATGYWEVNKTEWGAPIEEDSSAKADSYRKRYETVIAADHDQCLGSYVFLWGQKLERTPTWFGCSSNPEKKPRAWM